MESITKYFYANEESSFYDETAFMTDRAYHILHEYTFRLIERRFGSNNRRRFKEPLAVLDLGCGTGTEALPLLASIKPSKIVCVDNSQEMIRIFKNKVKRAYGEPTMRGRIAYCQADFRNTIALMESIKRSSQLLGIDKFDLVLSVYSLHHLKYPQKESVYEFIARILKKRGIFVNADLFGFISHWINSFGKEEEEKWINEQFGSRKENMQLMRSILGSKRINMRNKWLMHLRKENKLLPINSYNLNTKNILSEYMLLSRAGIKNIEVPFRILQSAILIASK